MAGAEAEAIVQETARPMGLLGPTIHSFRAALGDASPGDSITQVQRVAFLEGLDELAAALDAMGGGMASYLTTNVDKMKKNTDSSADPEYRQWLLDELPAHVACKTYLDDSAWMGSEWCGYTLEFFVELFAELLSDKEAKQSADAAYARTLSNRHSFFQRGAFNVALHKLPYRQDLLGKLQGDGAAGSDVLADTADFVEVGRPLAAFVIRCRDELQKLKDEGRKAAGR